MFSNKTIINYHEFISSDNFFLSLLFIIIIIMIHDKQYQYYYNNTCSNLLESHCIILYQGLLIIFTLYYNSLPSPNFSISFKRVLSIKLFDILCPPVPSGFQHQHQHNLSSLLVQFPCHSFRLTDCTLNNCVIKLIQHYNHKWKINNIHAFVSISEFKFTITSTEQLKNKCHLYRKYNRMF